MRISYPDESGMLRLSSGGILTDMGIFSKADGELVFWPFFAAGVIGFFLCGVSMVVKLVGTNEQQRRSSR